MLPVVCMFLAGLYVGLGSLGMAAARLVFKGSLPGKGGPPLPAGMPRGPFSREDVCEATRDSESKEARPSYSSDRATETGELCTDDAVDPRDSGRMSWVRNLAKREDRSLVGGGGMAAVAVETARPCSASGLGDGVGRTFWLGGCPFAPCPLV